MRNRTITLSKKLATIILCASMAVTTFTGCSMGNDDAKENDKTTETVTESTTNADEDTEETTAKVPAEGTGTATKAETVYVTADATGTVKEITVSDWLKNKDNYQTLTDATNLENLEAIKGTEDLGQSGQDLSIDANGNDVYYRGTLPTNTTLPVSVNIKYTLDGKEITSDKLEGATGHLGIHIKYTNNSKSDAKIDGKKKEINVPFLAATMLMVPSKKINHAEVEHGKIIEQGNSNVFLGYGFPGINESFGLEDGGVFTDTVDFEADVENYSSDMMMTFVTCEPFASEDLKEAVDFETVSDSIKEAADLKIDNLNDIHSLDDVEKLVDKLNKDLSKLKKGTKKLNDGSKELSDGAKKLQAGSKDLNTNYATFNSKMAVLSDGMNTAYTGAKTLNTNMKTAYTSSKTLATGAKQVSDGVNQLSTAMTGMYATITKSISDNDTKMAQLKQALAQAKPGSETYTKYFAQLNQLGGANEALKTIKTQMDRAKLADNLKALSAGAKQVSDGNTKLSAGLSKLYGGTKQISTGLATLNDGTTRLTAASKKINKGTGTLYKGTKALYKGSKELYTGTNTLYKASNKLGGKFGGNLSPLVDTTKAMRNAAKDYTTFTALPDGGKGTVTFVIKTE
ncbi:putative membrane protein [Lachnospiraceae bacterium XBB1006]|nr:putative membrane protein [Lachnospiraceae bacterium XBB1006]